VVNGNEFLDLSWSTVPTATDYEAYYSEIDDSDEAVKWDGEAAVENGSVSLSINGLENDIDYFVWAKAINGAGASPFSRSVRGKPSAATDVPSAPTSLVIVEKNKRLDLSWTSSAFTSGYKVYYHTENSTEGRIELPEIPHTPGKVSAVIRELKNATTYYVWVYASNNVGDSASAATGSGSPQAKPPLEYDHNSKVIGTASETVRGDSIIKLVCESAAWFARENYGDLYDIDFLFYNIGIISGTQSSIASGVLQKGEITISNVKAVLPYGDDKLTIISLKGVDVIEMFRPHGSGPKAVGIASKEIVGNFFNGAPIDPDRDYIIATSSYLVGGGDGYTVLKDNATVLLQTGIPSWQPLVDYIYDQEDPIAP
jgi:hypothetical protein